MIKIESDKHYKDRMKVRGVSLYVIYWLLSFDKGDRDELHLKTNSSNQNKTFQAKIRKLRRKTNKRASKRAVKKVL